MIRALTKDEIGEIFFKTVEIALAAPKKRDRKAALSLCKNFIRQHYPLKQSFVVQSVSIGINKFGDDCLIIVYTPIIP